MARSDEAIEIGAQRRAAVGRERRAHPAGLRGVPRRLQIALRPRGRRQPVRRRAAARVRRQLLVHPRADPLIDALPLDLGPRLRVAIERARPPVEHALARVAGQQVAGCAAPSRTPRRRRRTRRRRYSASPRPTMYSARSRGAKRCGSIRRSRSRALVRSSDAALSRNRSRYARAATRSAASARAGVRRACSAALTAASNCRWL